MQKSIKHFSDEASEIFTIFFSLGSLASFRLARDMVFSVNHFYVLGRNLTNPLDYPFAKKPTLPLSLINDQDLARLKEQIKSLDVDGRREMLGRIRFHGCGFSNCYVMREGEEIAYLQWLIFPSENEIISRDFPSKFYPLSNRQVMVENVYTFPRYRGRGLLPYGTLSLLEIARDKGYTSAISYIRKDNITSLNEFSRMGFKITKIVKEYKFMGRAWRTL